MEIIGSTPLQRRTLRRLPSSIDSTTITPKSRNWKFLGIFYDI
jgi:hypothetical protein